jgi:hypothetical protein
VKVYRIAKVAGAMRQGSYQTSDESTVDVVVLHKRSRFSMLGVYARPDIVDSGAIGPGNVGQRRFLLCRKSRAGDINNLEL